MVNRLNSTTDDNYKYFFGMRVAHKREKTRRQLRERDVFRNSDRDNTHVEEEPG